MCGFSEINFPDEITPYIQGRKVEEITEFHRSGDKVYQIENDYILKVSNRISDLRDEMNRNDYLINYLPVPKTIAFVVENNQAFYLKQYLVGKPLCHEEILKNPDDVISYLCDAITMIHSVDITNCPYRSKESCGEVFVHGDMCLPNILVSNGQISGIIDLDGAGIGDPYIDYCWALWSLEYNLKTNEFKAKNEKYIKKG